MTFAGDYPDRSSTPLILLDAHSIVILDHAMDVPEHPSTFFSRRSITTTIILRQRRYINSHHRFDVK